MSALRTSSLCCISNNWRKNIMLCQNLKLDLNRKASPPFLPEVQGEQNISKIRDGLAICAFWRSTDRLVALRLLDWCFTLHFIKTNTEKDSLYREGEATQTQCSRLGRKRGPTAIPEPMRQVVMCGGGCVLARRGSETQPTSLEHKAATIRKITGLFSCRAVADTTSAHAKWAG